MLTAAALVAAGPVAAAKRPRAAVVQQLLDCRGTADATARLACFDAAAAKLGEADAKNDVVVVDRAAAVAAEREAFGLAAPTLGALFDADKRPTVSQIESVVAAAAKDGEGNWRVTLADGSVWRQTDGKPLGLSPAAGTKVVIRTASFGSYFMRLGTQVGVRAKRER